MEFGMQFFPCVGPEQKSGAQYFDECLRLVEFCDRYGWGHVRTVEHYFRAYGGSTPNPVVFLAAAAQRTKKARLVTGAVLPVFNNPLKLAGEIGMLDAISGGRLDVGFARAFLPYEFANFKVSVNDSRDRFTEGLEQVRLLLENDNASHEGKFHSFKNVTSLPRPTQKPRPPFWPRADAEAAPVLLGRRHRHARELHQRRQGRPCDHGHTDGRRSDEGTARALPRGLETGRASRPGAGHAGVPQ